ncbi:DUF4445 domain-containing protein, partial [Candidatus Aerophobetes bacterium]|nr:DUF4445 domain-containing protein [Candidatus Aerophobetes bacterium]
VISRISYVQEKGERALKKLQGIVRDTVNKLIDELIKTSQIKRENIYQAVIVGNTVMQHLFLGLNPLNLGLFPYVPVVQDVLKLKSSEVKIKINPGGRVYVFPCIGGFIGGDTVGVILSTGLYREDNKIKIAADLGTNGEIVLSVKDKIVATSTAAGPAFEGVKISCGMGAQKGAIEKIKLCGGNVNLEVIGGGEPAGICGSGLVDGISEFYREGIIDSSGRIKPKERQKGIWKDRIVEDNGERKFVLTEKDKKPHIYISQKDVREFQLAKAAICAGIRILLKKAGIHPGEVEKFFIAGGFGSYLNLQNAYQVGLFPVFSQAEVKVVGNAAMAGAVKVLLSSYLQKEVTKIPSRVCAVELATKDDFQTILSECMFIGKVT